MDLARFARIMARSWILILLTTAVAGAIAFFVSQELPRTYQSEARVLVGSITDPTLDITKLEAYQQLAQTYAELTTTTTSLARIASELGLPDDPTRLAQRLSVRAPLGDSIVQIVATASSASDAAQLANAAAGQIVQLGTARPGTPGLASVVAPAVPPSSPSSPLVTLNTAVAAALGLALGVGLALLMASREEPSKRRIRELEAQVEVHRRAS